MSTDEDIAIVGMSCLLPGSRDVSAFWSNILAGESLISDASDAWCNGKFEPDSDKVERIYTRRVGQLGDLAEFDPVASGVIPKSVPAGEPDQFLALRMAMLALEDSGYHQKPFDRSATGVVLGRGAAPNPSAATAIQHCLVLDQTMNLLEKVVPEMDEAMRAKVRQAFQSSIPPLHIESLPGLVSNVAAGRIANRLDLQGPSYLIDAACSSTLVAVELAMKELRSGQCGMMLAGGVQASMPPQVYMMFCGLGALSRTEAKPFDRDADGTILSEGAGFLVLKRRSDAERDGDRIYAVLKSVGVASDGRAQGLLTPRLEGEVLAIQRAYEQSGIDPNTVGLVEAHGTGIPLGDRTESAALRKVFGEGPVVPRIALGSVKSMIGHCIPAAGVASLVKTALALYYKLLPPTRCGEVSPDLGLEDSPIYVNNVARPWIHAVDTTPRRAGIDGFGFGGINAHALLEEVPLPVDQQRSGWDWPYELFLLAADSAGELAAIAERLHAALDSFEDSSLASVAKGLIDAERSGKFRLAIVAESVVDLREKLAGVAGKIREEKRPRLQTRTGVFFDISGEAPRGGTAFVFPGQGSQYKNMLADLCMAFPAVRREFDVSDRAYIGVWKNPTSQLNFPPPTCLSAERAQSLDDQIFDIDVATELVFTAGKAMYRLLCDFGVKCDRMLGHSTGEYTALSASGIIEATGAEEYEVRARLNRIYREVNTAENAPRGSLLTVGAVDPAVLEQKIAATDGRVVVAIDNCPHQKILFGAPDDMVKLEEELRALGGVCQLLPFNTAYHTALFEPMRETLRRYYEELRMAAPQTRMLSCASLTDFPNDIGAIRDLATMQWIRPVRFREAIEHLHANEGVSTFIEVGPSSHLTSFIEDTLRKRDFLAVATNDRRRSGLDQFLRSIGQLWTRGMSVDFTAMFRHRAISAVDPFATKPPEKAANRHRIVLNLQMPEMTLSDPIVAELRELTTRGRKSPTPQSANAEVSIPATPLQGIQTSAVQPGEVGASPTKEASREAYTPVAADLLFAHENLMREFLASQERTIDAVVASQLASQSREP